MVHSCAMLRKSDNRWIYTRGGQPYGYCQPGSDVGFSEEKILSYFDTREQYDAFIAPYQEAVEAGKFHDTGHETKEEALECMKRYMIDFELRFQDDRESSSQQNRCRVCRDFTSGAAWLVLMVTMCFAASTELAKMSKLFILLVNLGNVREKSNEKTNGPYFEGQPAEPCGHYYPDVMRVKDIKLSSG